MKSAWFRFYEELNDFLPVYRKKQLFSYQFTGHPAVKDVIESLGIPHPEVDLILVNGESVEFSRKLNDSDQVSVYPVFETLDISEVQHLRAKPLRDVRFIADVHMGKLARYLRLLGFDTICNKDFDDNKIIEVSLEEKRIILTRDLGILKNGKVTHGYWIRSTDPVKQTEEVVCRFCLQKIIKPFTRCLECNTTVKRISKYKVSDRLLPDTNRYYEHFSICPGCNRIYWEGSHYEKMKEFVESLKHAGK